MRNLQHLAKVEKSILQRVRDIHRYADWERRGKPPPTVYPRPLVFLGLPPKPKKPDKINKLMVVMLDAQQHCCVLCAQPLIIDNTLKSDHPDRPSFDHVVSKAKGGQDQGNRIAVHRQCNSIKSNRDPTGCELIWLDVVNLAIETYNKSLKTKWIR